MEIWIIYALFGMVFAGIFTFAQKIAAERGYSGLEYSFSVLLGQIITSFIIWWFIGFPMIDLNQVWWLAIIVGLITLVANVLRIQALSYVDTAIFFPIYKAIGPVIITVAGIYLFHEKLSNYEILGIVMGIIIPLLLIHKSENGRQNNLKKGLSILIVTILLSTFLVILQKVVVTTEINLFLFILISSFVAAIAGFIYIFILKNHKKNHGHKPKLAMYKFGMSTGVLMVFGVYFILKSLEGSIAIAYTINSFYILIPIILSIIIYKEHINLRKGFAITLSLAAILLFQL